MKSLDKMAFDMMGKAEENAGLSSAVAFAIIAVALAILHFANLIRNALKKQGYL